MSVCERLTKAKRLCGRTVLLQGFGTPGERRFPSCYSHLTAEELEEYLAVARKEKAARKAWETSAPICWSWPTPDLATWAPTVPEGLSAAAADRLSAMYRDSEEARATCLLQDWQAGRCAICGSGGHLVEDHDHRTGLTRGMLCRGCNVREGSSAHQGSAGTWGQYRRRPPTSILGIRIRYWDPFLNDYAAPEPFVPQARSENPWLSLAQPARDEAS